MQEFCGDTYLEERRPKDAMLFYDDAWGQAVALMPRGDVVAELRRRRADCFYLLERTEEAYSEASCALEHCRKLGDRYEEAATYRILALSAASLGKAAEAKQWFDQGFAYYEDIETPYEWGKLWMAYGDWLRGPHAAEYADPRGALEAYHAARDHFAGMGAEGKLAEVNLRILEMTSAHERIAAQVAEAAVSSPLVRDLRGPQRRPRGMAELDRRSAWAHETFGFVTRSKIVLDLLEMTAKLAPSGSPILILGESGTGKELVAHGIHKLSGRTGNFMPINCAAVPRDVIESELFGHVAGAFTGATRDKPGLFESCDHGTVFLDEIAEMSLDLQSRLLRYLEKGEFRRVGSNKLVAVDTLIVAATNCERGSLEKGGTFRPDLYYRLAHAVITIPPLRRRPEDVDLLIGHFLEEASVRYRKQVSLSDEARNRLVTHSWPGNARQLRSTITRLVVLADPHQPIPPEAVHLDETQAAGSLTEELEQAERQRIAEALVQARGIRTEAARALGMSRTTLIGKMKRYGIR
jgi:two-component system, NtrC family, response regulator